MPVIDLVQIESLISERERAASEPPQRHRAAGNSVDATAHPKVPAVKFPRRFASLLFALLLVTAFLSPTMAQGTTIRIGVQKYGTLIVLQLRGTLAQRLAAQGVNVEWKEFPSGPPLLEALSAGSIDFCTTGEAPPIFAQAAGSPLLYVGVEPSAPAGEAILVPKDSPICSIADLKGKRIALNKGSNVHYLLVAALAKTGLQPSDVTPVYQAPADARAAFERGSVDAWVIWDPFLAAAQQATQARILADGTGVARNYQFYLAHRDFARAHPELVRILIEEVATADAWAATRQHEVAGLLAPRTGLSPEVLEVALGRLAYGIEPLDADIVDNQQHIADVFHSLGLLPKPITVRDTVWNPQS
jgi:sulfonate transport system substrate-binding protein